MPAVMWFRRDLRLRDNPALLAAGPHVAGLFVLDPVLLRHAGAPRLDYMYDALRALNASMDGRLVVRSGDPVDVVPDFAAEVGAREVHVAADFGPYGRARDAAVGARIPLVATGSPYAVAPGRITNGSGNPYKVFTPFHRAWLEHGWRAPAGDFGGQWLEAPSDEIPVGSGFRSSLLPPAGEWAALQRLTEVVKRGGYEQTRDLPGIDGTSMLSAALRWGCIHPRTILASPIDDVLRKEICWREFYADVLARSPETARDSMALQDLQWDEPGATFEAWCSGRTGYPIVDAGMRQLVSEGWMHNRVRMIVASFLVKDLHIHWRHGARFFMQHLVDGDLASNSHGWQWTAGTGTDASPFFRVFNPTLQGRKFDPDGDYIRRYVPELRTAADVHEPRPHAIVDHAVQRLEALRRLECVKT